MSNLQYDEKRRSEKKFRNRSKNEFEEVMIYSKMKLDGRISLHFWYYEFMPKLLKASVWDLNSLEDFENPDLKALETWFRTKQDLVFFFSRVRLTISEVTCWKTGIHWIPRQKISLSVVGDLLRPISSGLKNSVKERLMLVIALLDSFLTTSVFSIAE